MIMRAGEGKEKEPVALYYQRVAVCYQVPKRGSSGTIEGVGLKRSAFLTNHSSSSSGVSKNQGNLQSNLAMLNRGELLN